MNEVLYIIIERRNVNVYNYEFFIITFIIQITT
jgi:hypothetical protein